jgi:glycosyltransferase involved in cell wall biosynthesis
MLNHFSCKDLVDKTLLIITPDYPNTDNQYIGEIYVKRQLDELKKYFGKIVVIAPVPFSWGILDQDRLCQNYHYDNVSVYYPRCLFLPRSLSFPLLEGLRPYLDARPHVVERLIEREGIHFDIIHTHFTWPSAYIGTRLKKTYKKPIVATIHEDSDWLNEEIEQNHPYVVSAWEQADALIRVNKKDVPALKRYNPNTSSIPNGYGPDFKPMEMQRCRQQLHLPKDKKVIFSLGALIERKGFNYLIDAMKLVSEERKDVVCYIGGSGPLKDALNRQIEDSNLTSCIKLVGFIPDELLPIWMNACDLFVLPSLAESFGIVQIEALACGKPVVSARNSGSEEVIASEEYGLLAKPADPSDLAEKIFTALGREWDSKKIVTYAQQYTWTNIANRIVQVYNAVL